MERRGNSPWQSTPDGTTTTENGGCVTTTSTSPTISESVGKMPTPTTFGGWASSGALQPSNHMIAGNTSQSSGTSFSPADKTAIAVGATLSIFGVIALAMLAMWWTRRARQRERARWIRPFTNDRVETAPPSAGLPFLTKSTLPPSNSRGMNGAIESSRRETLSAAVAQTRAMHNEHLARIQEMERAIAAHGDRQDSETVNLRRELALLREQVQALSEALRAQTEELRRAADMYGSGPPPLYEESSDSSRRFRRI